jgi:hypothetical protein
MGQAKPHIGGGPKPVYLYYNTFSNKSHHLYYQFLNRGGEVKYINLATVG